MNIFLTNTATRKKETFAPIVPNEVKIYSCGPTVYNYVHIGNLRAYVFVDILKRMFRANNYSVKHVMNITDVGHLSSDADEGEDKLEKGAIREGKTVWEVAKFYTEAFLHDINILGIKHPGILCRATQHILEMIILIQKLEKQGYTYIADGNVYYDTSKFQDYGKMAKLNLSLDAIRSRTGKDFSKKSPLDFVLWFTRHKYTNHAMQWNSPWGKGFPGWHIECSAMASKYLGDHFDIHTGGIDHIPVHHTNEIAQSEGAFGHKWVNYWLHNNFLNIKKGKMAKSDENFLKLQALLDKGYDPMDYRYYLLGGHYRNPMFFSFKALDGARNSLKRLKAKITDLAKQDLSKPIMSDVIKKYWDNFLAVINDDLNTAKALTIVWKTVDDENLNPSTKLKLFNIYDEVLGLGLFKEYNEKIPTEIIALAKERQTARQIKNWARSDELRVILTKKGYHIKDRKDGYEIQKIV